MITKLTVSVKATAVLLFCEDTDSLVDSWKVYLRKESESEYTLQELEEELTIRDVKHLHQWLYDLEMDTIYYVYVVPYIGAVAGEMSNIVEFDTFPDSTYKESLDYMTGGNE
jgi:hypothetical protein